MWVDRIIEDARSDRQTAVLARAMGAKGVEAPPSVEERVAAFEASLEVEPKLVSDDERRLRQALGLRG